MVIGNFEYQIEGIDIEVIKWNSESEISDLQKSRLGLSIKERAELKKLHVRHSEISPQFYNNIL